MFALIALLLLGAPEDHALPLDSLGISATPSTNWYSYTNKEAGFYFGEIDGSNVAPFQGWTVYNELILKDYSLSVDGRRLDRSGSRVTVFPDRLVRVYASGITETFTLLDSINAFSIQVRSQSEALFDFRLLFNSSSPGDFGVTGRTVKLLENKTTPAGNFGKWVAVVSSGMQSVRDPRMEGPFASPALFRLQGRDISIVVACGKSGEEARRTASYALRKLTELQAHRRGRMQDLLDRSCVSTGNAQLDKALSWAKLSLDALVTNQGMKGIWAGLPWFNDYWGRDSFISLAGATLWLGNFEEARRILLDFAAKQDTDSAGTYYGRIPNLITPKETTYNTADGTPRFVNAAYIYYTMTGDSDFLCRIYPVIKRAFEGILTHHADDDYFLTHGDQETWMDAAGPNGPYVPRGNRAVDLQALWYEQLLSTKAIAMSAGDSSTSSRAGRIAAELRTNFNDKFIDPKSGLLYDHLKEDNSPDTSMRPNQLFALDLVNNPAVRARIVKAVTEELDYPWGAASLYQGDPNFHPFHHNEPYYVPDAAYHNGTVWVWLTGLLVSALTKMGRVDFAFRNTHFLAGEILGGKAAGTLPELFDAFPREDQTIPNESGAFSQAWSLAEFIESFYEDYLGVGIDADSCTISLSPRLPAALRNVTFRLDGGKCGNYLVSYRFGTKPAEVEVTPLGSVAGTTLKVCLPISEREDIESAFRIAGSGSVVVRVSSDSLVAEQDGRALLPEYEPRSVDRFVLSDSLHFQTPKINLDWKFAHESDFEILKLKDVKRQDGNAQVFAGADDPAGDDRGATGTYVYSLNQNFHTGIFDITHAAVSYDSTNVYFTLKFKDLVNPMWHPEYGYQLTFVAIAIGNGKGGEKYVGRNSDYVLPADRGFQRIIYVGGGIEVFNAAGKKLAVYVPAPADTSNPLGSVGEREISFSLPVSLIGRPARDWRVSILAGAQDDHGGGGVGEFRTVGGKAAEWQGGGKKKAGQPNVFDELMLK